MFQLSTEQIATLDKLNSSIRFVHQAPTYEEDPQSGRPVLKKHGRITCEVFDKTTSQHYLSVDGEDEKDAATKAIAKAIDAEKPLTPAQKMTKNFKAQDAQLKTVKGELEKAREENAKLKAELEAATTKK
jgi:hypothetical protein